MDRINKSKLQEALEIVKPGLSSNLVMEQTTSFAFTKGYVLTYNDEISLRHPIKDVTFEGVINAEELYKFLSKVNKEIIELSTTDSEVILKSGRIKAGFTLVKEILLPLGEINFTRAKWIPLPINFISQLTRCAENAGTSLSKPVLMGVHISTKGFGIGSDGIRLVKALFSSELKIIKDILLPADCVKNIRDIQAIEIFPSTNWVHFRNKAGSILSCRVFNDKFPVEKISSILDVKGKKIVFPTSMIMALDRSVSIMKKDFGVVDIKIEGTGILIESKSENAWFKELIQVERPFKDSISFCVSAYLLKDILKESNNCIYSDRMLKFIGKDWEYVVMQIEQIKQNKKS